MPKSKEPNFEGALGRLEEIVRQLETNEAALEDSLKLFEEGIRLARFCQTRLDEAKKKIEILVKETGELRPFDDEAIQ